MRCCDAFFELGVETVELSGFAIQLNKDLHLCLENFRDHGHRHIVDRAGAIAFQEIVGFEAHGRNEDDRRLLMPRVISDHRRKLEPVEIGHADVHQDDRDLGFQKSRQRFLGGRRLDQCRVQAVEDRLVSKELARLVIDKQDVDRII